MIKNLLLFRKISQKYKLASLKLIRYRVKATPPHKINKYTYTLTILQIYSISMYFAYKLASISKLIKFVLTLSSSKQIFI